MQKKQTKKVRAEIAAAKGIVSKFFKSLGNISVNAIVQKKDDFTEVFKTINQYRAKGTPLKSLGVTPCRAEAMDKAAEALQINNTVPGKPKDSSKQKFIKQPGFRMKHKKAYLVAA